MTPRRVAAWVAAAVLAGLVPAGCGVPLDATPRDVSDARIPYRAGAPAGDVAGPVVERLCFVRDGRLVRAVRRVTAVRTPGEQLQDLLAGPTAEESASRMSSALTTGADVVLTLPQGRATVDVGDRTEQGLRSDEVLAFGQIVCTLTSQGRVGTVSFTSRGAPLGVPRADGSLAEGPVTIADYVALMES